MKYLMTLILIFFTFKGIEMSKFDKNICFDFDDDLMITNYTLLYQVCWGEARGEGIKGVSLVIETIKNRISSEKFPSTLDSVITQKNQYYVNTDFIVPKKFKETVDSLYKKKPVTPYLYFVNFDKLKKMPNWVKKKKWYKHGRHSFAT